jgi:uncharacterized phage infection (PIP) family protein YhgE
MEDKVFDLLERLYVDVQDMKTDMQSMKTGMRDMKTGMQDMKTDMQDMKTDMQNMKDTMATKQDLARLENKMDINHKALYDGYKQSIEGIQEIKYELNKLTDRVENQEIQLQVIKTAK